MSRLRSRADVAGALGLLAVLAAFALLFWPSLSVPFERDEGEYAYGADLIARGGMPYRDASIQKPPGIVLLYAAVSALFGPAAEHLHLAVLASHLSLIALVYLLGRRLADPAVGLTAAALLAAALMMPVYEAEPANTEVFMVLATAAAVLALPMLRDRPAAWPAGWAGACAGIAVLFKHVAVVNAAHVALGVWLAGGPARRRVGRLALAGACAALPVAACAIWLAARGALPGFFDSAVLHNLEYAASNPEGPFAAMLWRRLLAFGRFDVLLWVGAAVGLAATLARGRRWPAFVAGGWLGASMLGLSGGGYFRGHYLIQALPPLALCAALGSALAGRFGRPALLAVLLAVWISDRPWIFGLSVEQQLARRYHSLRFASSLDIADHLRARECHSLFVLASEPQLYHYSGCRAVTSMILMNPLFGGYPSSRRRQEETFAAIQRDPPDFIVLARRGVPVPMFRVSDPWFYDRVFELLGESYVLEGVTLFDRRGVHAPESVDPNARPPRFDLLIFRRAS